MMNRNYIRKNEFNSSIPGILKEFIPVLCSWYFYLGLVTLIAGMELNFISQTYLFNYINEGRSLPELSDLILDSLPLYDVSLIYDLFSSIPVLVVFVYIVHKNDYKSIPFFLLMCGIIELVRGIFIVLTPLGNPPGFLGSNTLLNGFSKYELGVYPSGHVGSVYLLLLMVKTRLYKWIILFCLILVISSLLLAHAHYSIDILSGFLFAYAINSFGNKHLSMFRLENIKVRNFKNFTLNQPEPNEEIKISM